MDVLPILFIGLKVRIRVGLLVTNIGQEAAVTGGVLEGRVWWWQNVTHIVLKLYLR